MSFSSRAKEEMTVKLPKQKCCEKARIFGILLFSGGFTRSGISVTTEIAETIELVRRFFSETFGDEGKTETVASKSGKALRFSVNDNNTVEAAFAYFGIGEDDMMDDIFSLSAEISPLILLLFSSRAEHSSMCFCSSADSPAGSGS